MTNPGMQWLGSLRDFEADRHGDAPNLRAISAVLDAVADPQRAYKVIHVTGTNGKGSVVHFASRIALGLGMSIGCYSSPDLGSVTERITINGVAISEEELDQELSTLAQLIDSLGLPTLTKFEALTAAALSLFALYGVELAVVEVGMGGLWDATNVVDGDVAVISNVGLDHSEYLGETLAEIAEQKSGIIKEGSIVVSADQDPSVTKVIAEAVERAHAIVRIEGREIRLRNVSMGLGGWYGDIITPKYGYEELFVGSHGRFQFTNAALAVVAMEEIVGGALPQAVLSAALGLGGPPGRAEVASRDPLVVLDVGHNPMAATALGETLRAEFPTKSGWVVLTALAQGRDPLEFLGALGPSHIDELYALGGPGQHVDPVDVAHAASILGIRSHLGDDVDSVMRRVRPLIREDQLILVTGGHQIVGQARRFLS